MRPTSSSDDRQAAFQRQLGRMLLCFLAVAAIDVLVVSFFSGKLRCWFPAWIDPQWQDNPASPVLYSQSYIAGILFIPLLSHAIERAFLAERGRSLRIAYRVATVAVLSFVLWWKGGLMIQHHKEREALGWVVLTALVWLLVRAAPAVEQRFGALRRERLLSALLAGLVGFFVLMAVVDPLVQVGVHGLAVSRGLVIEVGFFLPAAVVCWLVRRRLLGERSPEASRAAPSAEVARPQAGQGVR